MLQRVTTIVFLVLLTACGSNPISTQSETTPIVVTTEPNVLEVTPTLARVNASTSTALPKLTLAVPTDSSEIVSTNTESVPLTLEGLAPLLLQDKDLVGNWTGGKIYSESPVDYSGPTPALILNQGLVENGSKFPSGNIILWVFTTQEDASTVYNNRMKLIKRTVDKDVAFQRPSIGDQAFLAPGKGTVFIVNQLVLLHCKAVVEIRVGTNSEIEQTINYATNLDQRIQPTVCR